MQIIEPTLRLSQAVRDALVELQSLVSVDPERGKRCTEPTCGGKRGWYGVKVFENDGRVNAQLMICCGRLGGSDYDKVMRRINGVVGTTKSEVDVVRFEVLKIQAQVEELTRRHRFLRKPGKDSK